MPSYRNATGVHEFGNMDSADLTIPYRHYSAIRDDLGSAIEGLGDLLPLHDSPGTAKAIRASIAALVRVDMYLLQHIDE